jgi:hypothetical protein
MLQNPEIILELQSAVGSSLWQCQALESSIVHCLIIGHKVGRDADKDLVEKLYAEHGDFTLGRLIKGLESVLDIPLEIKSKLKLFKDERNWLAHKSWSEILPYANSNPPNKLYDYLGRIIKIGDDALALSKLLADILDERTIKAGLTKEFLEKETQRIYSRWLAG